MVRLMLTFCTVSTIASAQDDLLAWFPLKIGARWVYDHEAKAGDRNHPDVDRWTTEETIAARLMIPEGLFVLRQVKDLSPLGPIVTRRVIGTDGVVREVQLPVYHSPLAARDSQPYLVHGNCLYLIPLHGGWDGQDLSLKYRQFLNEGTLVPDFCFPLEPGRWWGNNDISWHVGPARDAVASILPATYAGAIHMLCPHFGSGGTMDVWFQRGVGVVAEHYIHSGTYDEYTKTLRSLVP